MADPLDDLRTEAGLRARIAELTSLIARAENERRTATDTAARSAIEASNRRLDALTSEARRLGDIRRGTDAASSSTERLNRVTREYNRELSTSSASEFGGALTGVTKAIYAQAAEAENAIEQMTEYRRRSVQDIVDIVGGSSQLVIAYANDATTAIAFNASQSRGEAEKLAAYYEQMGNQSAANLARQNSAGITAVNSTNQVLMNSQAYMTELYAQMLNNNKENTINNVSLFELYGGSVSDIMMKHFGDILRDPTLRKAFSFDFLDVASAEKNVGEYTRTIDLLMRGLGVTSQEMQSFVEYNLNATGKASLDYALDVGKASEAASRAFGLDAKQIEKDIASMTGQVGIFGFRSATEFAAISAAATAARMSVSELQGVMGKFETLQSATDTVGRLNATLGTNLDAVSLMQKRFSDIPAFVKELADGLRTGTMSYEEIIKKQAIFSELLKTLNIDSSAAQGLFKGNLEDITKQLTLQKEELDKSNDVFKASLEARAELPDVDPERRIELEALRQQELMNIGLERVQEAQRSNSDLLKMVNDIGEKFGPKIQEYSKILYEYNRNLQMFGKISGGLLLQAPDMALLDSLLEKIRESQESSRKDFIERLIAEKQGRSEEERAKFDALIAVVERNVAAPGAAVPIPAPPPTIPPAPPPAPTAPPQPATTAGTPTQPTATPPAPPAPAATSTGNLVGSLVVDPSMSEAKISFPVYSIVEAVIHHIAQNPAAFGPAGGR